MKPARLPVLLNILVILVLAACNTPAPIATESLPPAPTESEPGTATTPPPPSDTPSAGAAPLTNGIPASGPLTIVALGDSLTEGQGDDSGSGGYPPRLQALVEALRPGTQVQNFGHSGWASIDLINGLEGQPSQLEQAEAADADIALVWIGSNDLWYLYEYGPEQMTVENEQLDLQTYEANLDTILSRLSQAGATMFIALLDDQSKRPVVADPPNPAEPALPYTTAEDLARMSTHITAYNEIIRRKAAEYGALTVDFYNTDIFTSPATLYDDGNHPNIAGYEQIAQIWFAALEPYLK
jgi:lysophospholipase L1-like esterase